MNSLVVKIHIAKQLIHTTTMEDQRINTQHVYAKKRKLLKKLEKEQRAKRNVNPSRRIRHALTERWIPDMEYDETGYTCMPWTYPYDDEFCGECEKCTGKPAKLVENGCEELTFDYP